MKKIFKLHNLFPVILVVYIIKSFLVQPGHFDIGVVSLMSIVSAYMLKLNKDEVSDKQELKDIISQLEDRVNEKITTLQSIQDKDRLSAEGKFSTINMGMHRKSQVSTNNEKFSWS